MNKQPRGRPRSYHRHRPSTNAERCRAYRQRRNRSVHFRSGSDVRETPQWLFEKWDAQFHFTLDACALPENAKCARYFTPAQDGLAQDWGQEVVWCNPPYGRAIGRWLQKAYEASKVGATVVCLIPFKGTPRWCRDWVWSYAEVIPEDKRVKFGGAKHNAPFDSAVAIYRPPPVARSGGAEEDSHGSRQCDCPPEGGSEII